MLDRQHGAEARDALRQTASETGVTGEPVKLLEPPAATRAIQSAPRNDQDGPRIKDVQVADPPHGNVVHLVHFLEAATAPLNAVSTWFQLNLDHGVGLAVLGINSNTADARKPVAFPAAEQFRKFIVGQRWISCLSGLETGNHQAG
jgi:hypothetical protein